MFSQTVEYALRAVAHLAYEAPNPRTTEQIAEATRVPQAYLSKVLQALSRAGIVRSAAGRRRRDLARQAAGGADHPGGGQRRRADPADQTCPLGLKSHGVRLCPLHRRLDDAMASVEAAFGGTTLAEVLAEPTPEPAAVRGGRGPGPARRRSTFPPRAPGGYSVETPPNPSCALPLLWAWSSPSCRPAVAAPFELKPTDRLVLIGNTLVEREQRYGYWEAMLTARAPD